MLRHLARGLIAATAVVAGLATAAAGTSSAGRGLVAAGPGAQGAASTQLWAQRFSGPSNGTDSASSVAVSPDGGTVFVTGTVQLSADTFDTDFTTVAYNAGTGQRLWLAQYNGPGNGTDSAASVAVSPDGTRVFVTGRSAGLASGLDYATVAYRAATGKVLWASRYNGPGNGEDIPAALTESPDGTTVIVTGQSTGASGGRDYATVAYRAATGEQRWVSRYNGAASGDDIATALSADPAGGRVYVTGSSYTGPSAPGDFVTVAYSTATGHRVWLRRYGSASDGDVPASVAATTTGTVVVAGTSGNTVDITSPADYTTVAYRAATGGQLWLRHYRGPAGGDNGASALAVNPAGTAVFVTGHSYGGPAESLDFATVAYAVATGKQLWVKRYDGTGLGPDEAWAVAVSPDGRKVFVTGHSSGTDLTGADYATVGYSARTGTKLWVMRYNAFVGYSSPADIPSAVAVSPDSATVVVTGESYGGPATGLDYATVAYRS